jgi:hypothetical protein
MRNAVQTVCIFILLGVLSCKSKTSKTPLADCSELHAGKFEYRGFLEDSKIYIERSDTLQTETESISGVAMNFRITWVSPCEYTLKFLSFVDEKLAQEVEAEPIGMATSKVIKMTPNYYISQTVIMGQSGVQKDTILIIR